MKRIVFALIASMAVAAFAFARAAEDKPAAPTPKATVSSTNEVAVIKTPQGEIVLEFWSDVAPKTVENFKKLAREGFYNGTAFHRVISGFMIQGGDPLTKDPTMERMWGQGNPGYKIKGEVNSKKHLRGVISMAHSGHPDTAGSQFFICHGAASHLDGQYTAFGKVIKGLDVVDKIADCEIRPGTDKPVKRQAVESIKIVDATTLK